MRRTTPSRGKRDGRGHGEANDVLARLHSLLGREIEICAVIGEKNVPLGDLASALPGADLLLLPKSGSIRLLADGIDIGEGTAVEVGGRIALRIDRLRPLSAIAAELGGTLRGEEGDPIASP